MKTVKGDLIQLALDGNFDVIIHGCNCFCTMNSGIAKSIKETFPSAAVADKNTKAGDKSKLGYFTTATVKKALGPIIIVNAYTQYDYRRISKNQCMVDYHAIEDVFRRIKTAFSGQRLGYPRIGAGLGGGDWKIISGIIDRELKGENHTLVLL